MTNRLTTLKRGCHLHSNIILNLAFLINIRQDGLVFSNRFHRVLLPWWKIYNGCGYVGTRPFAQIKWSCYDVMKKIFSWLFQHFVILLFHKQINTGWGRTLFNFIVFYEIIDDVLDIFTHITFPVQNDNKKPQNVNKQVQMRISKSKMG